MTSENLQTSSPVSSRPGRRLLALGWLLLLAGIAGYFVQFLALKQYVVPWYAGVLGIAGFLAILAGSWQRWSILRIVGLVFAGLLTAFVWFFLLGTVVPSYAGPAVGQRLPAFAAIRADGTPFTDRDLAGQASVVVFFRGHW